MEHEMIDGEAYVTIQINGTFWERLEAAWWLLWNNKVRFKSDVTFIEKGATHATR